MGDKLHGINGSAVASIPSRRKDLLGLSLTSSREACFPADAPRKLSIGADSMAENGVVSAGTF